MSSDPQAAPQVLIVGSGPSGLILALSLLRNNVPVRIIEKSTTNRIGQRGAGIMPRSLEAFEALGILDEVLKQAINVPIFSMYKMPDGIEAMREFPIAPHLEPTPDRPYLNPVLLGQDRLDKIIRATLEKLGVTVELGTELQSLEQFDDKVNVRILKHDLNDNGAHPTVEEASYKWVVGADGAKSVVRKQLGLSFLGETKELRLIIGDIYAEGLTAGKWHIWGELSNLMTTVRSTETPGLFNFMIGGNNLGEEDQTPTLSNENAIRLLTKGTANRQDIKWGEVVCANLYRVNVRMVDQFKKGRAFVTGDAGHIHSPTGGQGMNTGIQDSYNLGWKLALVVKGLAPEGLLDTFNEERLPVVSEMLNITSGVLKRTLAGNEDAWMRTGDVNQLGVNYRHSSIVVDDDSEKLGVDRAAGSRYHIEVDDPVHAGDRAPDAPGLVCVMGNSEKTRLFNLFRPTRHTVLIFAGRVDRHSVMASLAAYPKDLVYPIVIVNSGEEINDKDDITFEDCDGHAYKAYRGPEGTSGIFVIRPDGVIGTRTGSIAGLKRFLNSTFHHVSSN